MILIRATDHAAQWRRRPAPAPPPVPSRFGAGAHYPAIRRWSVVRAPRARSVESASVAALRRAREIALPATEYPRGADEAAAREWSSWPAGNRDPHESCDR